MLLLKQPVQYKTANASQSMTGRVNVHLQIHMICIQAKLFPENSYNCYRFFSKMWENIFPVRIYFYLSSNDWRMCAQTAPVSWLLVKKTICDVSRKMSRNCFSQVFLIWAKKFTNMKSTNWTLLWSEVLIKSDRIWTFPTNWCFLLN